MSIYEAKYGIGRYDMSYYDNVLPISKPKIISETPEVNVNQKKPEIKIISETPEVKSKKE